MAESRSTQMPIGWGLVVLGTLVALLIGALYYFAYAPQRDALVTARQTVSRAAQERDDARRLADELAQESVALRGQIADLEQTLTALRQTGEGLEAQIREREDELAALRSTQSELVTVLQMEIANGLIQVQRIRDSLRVDMVNEILFASGEATLTPEGSEILRRIGDVLKGVADRQIVVQGHTDYVRIGQRLAQQFPTNWELSSARAVNVVRFLQEDVGVDPARLAATGFSEYRPRADNTTLAGRALNRRIEILLAPMPEPTAAAATTE